MLRKKIRKSQGGFTLIEIIAVLVILGILAAVAIPRFVNLQSDAQDKAIDGALAAAGSNVSMVFAQQVLTNGAAPTMENLAIALGDANYQQVGDFTVSYAASGTNSILVTLTGWPYSGEMPSTTKVFRVIN